MTNYRSIKRNELIRTIKSLKKSIKTKCYQRIGDEKRIGCLTKGCGLFPNRPWSEKQKKQLGKHHMRNIYSLPDLSKEAIDEFMVIYKKRYEIALSFEEAKKRAQQLMSLFMILFQPIR